MGLAYPPRPLAGDDRYDAPARGAAKAAHRRRIHIGDCASSSGAIAGRRWPTSPLRSRRRGSRVTLLLEIGFDDLASGGEPDAGVGGDEVERVDERPDAVRLADDPGMQRDAHHLAGLAAFFVEH